MSSAFRIVEMWFALLLTVGQLSRIAIEAVLSVSTSVGLIIGSIITLCITIALFQWDSDPNIWQIWRIGLTTLTIGIGIIGFVANELILVQFTTYEQYVYPIAVGLAILMEPIHQSKSSTQNTILESMRR